MTLKIAQDATRMSSRYWSWRAWIDGLPYELDEIDEVVWILHPTFTDPIRRTRSRETKFRLEESGWGEFQLRAEIHFKSQRVHRIDHWVELSENDERAKRRDAEVTSEVSGSLSSRRPAVFVSYTNDSASLVRVLVEALKSRNIDPSIDEDVPTGVDFRSWMIDKIYSSNALVAIISNNTGVLQDSEIHFALEARIPLIPVAVGQLEPRILDTLESYRSGESPSPMILKFPGAVERDVVRRDAAALADQIVWSIAASNIDTR